jgi:hypothetical protein
VGTLPSHGLTPSVIPPFSKLALDLGNLASKSGHHRRHLSAGFGLGFIQRQRGRSQLLLHAAQFVGH